MHQCQKISSAQMARAKKLSAQTSQLSLTYPKCHQINVTKQCQYHHASTSLNFFIADCAVQKKPGAQTSQLSPAYQKITRLM